MVDLGPDEYRELIRGALGTAKDADTTDPGLGTLFTPDSHRLALDPDVTVVRGARGTGKTYWSKALQTGDLRELAAAAYEIGALRRVRVLSGFGTERRPDQYPGPAVLGRLLDQRSDPMHIWTAVLLTALDEPSMTGVPGWEKRTEWVAQNPEALERALHTADRRAREESRTVLVVFDALDRLHARRSEADRLVDGILRLALDLRLSSRLLRAKVFIRPDMLDTAPLQFADSSKLTANTSDLTWSAENLYGLAFHQLGNGPEELAARFRSRYPGWQQQLDGRRNVAPRDVVGDRDRQREIFTEIAGPYMGTNRRRGHTYSWLPNHLMDGAEQVSPRSFLSALATAAERTRTAHSGHEHALHYDGIRAGVQVASRTRVDEITEDIPWVAEAVSLLDGMQVPAEEDAVTQRWEADALLERLQSPAAEDADPDQQVRTGPEARTDRELVRELIALGVMTRRADGRVDLPDVYRIAFNIGRKGGVPRVSPRPSRTSEP